MGILRNDIQVPDGCMLDDDRRLFNAKGQEVCGAKKRNKLDACKNTVISPTNGRCRLHGGTTPIGVEHHSYKTGRHSQAMGGLSLERYQTARKDPNLLALEDEIALLDTQINEWLGQIGESPNASQLGTLMRLLETRRRLSETERKRIAEASGMIPAERVRAVIMDVVDVIRNHVLDERIILGIERDIRRLAA